MVSKLRRHTAEALLLPWFQVALHVRTQDVNIDETPWREGPRRAYLWAVVTRAATLFRIAYRRTREIAQELLGTRYAGVATCGRLKSYWWIRRLQWCWAHLRRDFQAMIDRGNEGQGIGRALLGHSDRLFHLWHQLKQGQLSRARFRDAIGPVRRAGRRGVGGGGGGGGRKTGGGCAGGLGAEERGGGVGWGGGGGGTHQ